jgi:hypothetical protein
VKRKYRGTDNISEVWGGPTVCAKKNKKYSTPTRNHTIYINKNSDARDKSCAKRGKLVIYKEEEEKTRARDP